MGEAEANHWDGPPLEAWRPWRPNEAAAVLDGCSALWRVVGGWAIDLSIGRETRQHEDLEIAVARAEFPLIREHLEARGFVLYEAGDEEARRLAPGQAPNPRKHQNWVADPAVDVWRLDVMLEPGDAETWIFRRDERIRAPIAFMIAGGAMPHLKAHGALLYKAKALRPKDQADFANALPVLARDERRWLIEALRIAHPGHTWISALEAAG
ncbi:MAG TPA: hypothetical protein VKT30_05880 [Caulobacteraceae bacterium]|nr:hypothetical protein [Caulobacteraceae bacterium]